MEQEKFKKIGIYHCALGHKFELENIILSPFESRPCPVCGCGAGLIEVIEVKDNA